MTAHGWPGSRRPKRRALAGTACVLLSAGLALAGCGGGGGGDHAASTPTPGSTPTTATGKPASPSPTSSIAATDGPALAARAEKLLKNASSLRIRGTITKSGKTRSVDLRLDRSGHLEGSLGVGGQTLHVRATGSGTAYVKASDAFWSEHGGSAVAKLFHGKWIKATGSQAKELTGGITLDSFTKSVGTESKADLARVKAGHQRTIDGVPVIPLTGFPKQSGSTTGTVWVRANGEPYPVRFQGSGSSSDNVIHLSDFNKPVTVKAPPSSEVVDLSQLRSSPPSNA